MEFVSKFTEHDLTPGMLDTAFSIRSAHAAQLIPVIEYCSIVTASVFALYRLVVAVFIFLIDFSSHKFLQ